jgi:D-alanine-D-alanine ligase
MIVDRRGLVQVLELNTLPGMTNESLYPKSAKVAGLEFGDLMEALGRVSRDSGRHRDSDDR